MVIFGSNVQIRKRMAELIGSIAATNALQQELVKGTHFTFCFVAPQRVIQPLLWLWLYLSVGSSGWFSLILVDNDFLELVVVN